MIHGVKRVSSRPKKPPATDPPEAIIRCENCPVPQDMCKGQCKPGQAGPPGVGVYLIECRVRDLILRGWVNDAAICGELGISRQRFYRVKRRLRERGEIN